jgi:2-polyprenyl-6-hydroxyphenyl methylase/3-demethylubiquinone-9 3-methyltransferase
MLWGPSFARATARWQAKNWWTEYRNERGMSRWHDLVDWVGGYPFEVASPQKVVRFCEARGFRLERLISTRRLGCNQFSLRRVDNRPDANLVRSLDPDSATST